MKNSLLMLLALLVGHGSTLVAQSNTAYAVGNGYGDGSSDLYIVQDLESAPTAAIIGEAGVTLADIAIDPSGHSAYGVSPSTPSTLYAVDLGTGVASAIGSMGVGTQAALEFLRDGTLLSWGFGDKNLYSVDVTTGTVTKIFDTGFFAGGDLCVDGDGTVYGATTDSLIRFDLANKTATKVGGFGINQVTGLEVDFDGVMFASRGDAASSPRADLYRVDRVTGGATLIGAIAGASSSGIWGLSFEKTPDLQIYFDVSPEAAQNGDSVSLRAFLGTPSRPAIMVVNAINGVPTFVVLAIGNLDSAGEWTLQGVVPPGLSGISVEIETISLNSSSRLVTSNREPLAFN